jgi:hypothetical protein
MGMNSNKYARRFGSALPASSYIEEVEGCQESLDAEISTTFKMHWVKAMTPAWRY